VCFECFERAVGAGILFGWGEGVCGSEWGGVLGVSGVEVEGRVSGGNRIFRTNSFCIQSNS